MGAFGEKLRNQREQRGISLDSISTITKISPRMLRAIEDEHFDQLPGGVFNKGFVRAYARQVGLDEEEAVSDYLAALRESQIQSQTILPSFRNRTGMSTPDTEEASSTRRNPIDRGGNSLQNHNHGNTSLRGNPPENGRHADTPADRRRQTDDRRKDARRGEKRAARPHEVHAHQVHPNQVHLNEVQSSADPREERSNDRVPSSPLSFLNLTSAHSSDLPQDPEPIGFPASIGSDRPSRSVPWGRLAAALLLITLALVIWSFRRHRQIATTGQPAPSSHPGTAPAAAVPAAALPALASGATSAVTAALPPKHASPSTASAAQPAANSPDADVNPPVTKTHSLASAPKSPLSFTLLIRADQTSWVSISADGQPAAKETLIAPANTSVRASHEVIVKVGNAAGISFLLNGKEIPTHGNPGEVRTFTFDATGMRASAATQSTNTSP